MELPCRSDSDSMKTSCHEYTGVNCPHMIRRFHRLQPSHQVLQVNSGPGRIRICELLKLATSGEAATMEAVRSPE